VKKADPIERSAKIIIGWAIILTTISSGVILLAEIFKNYKEPRLYGYLCLWYLITFATIYRILPFFWEKLKTFWNSPSSLWVKFVAIFFGVIAILVGATITIAGMGGWGIFILCTVLVVAMFVYELTAKPQKGIL